MIVCLRPGCIVNIIYMSCHDIEKYEFYIHGILDKTTQPDIVQLEKKWRRLTRNSVREGWEGKIVAQPGGRLLGVALAGQIQIHPERYLQGGMYVLKSVIRGRDRLHCRMA